MLDLPVPSRTRTGPRPATRPTDSEVLFAGEWTQAPVHDALDRRRSDRPGAVCMFTFRGDRIAWFAGMGPDHGYADVYLDDVLEETVDAYAAEPSDNQLVFERAGLRDAVHSVRIVVRRERHPLATGCIQSVDGFDAEEAVHYPSHLRALAMEELRSIAGGTQSWTPPETFNPIVRRAAAPATGVTVTTGWFRDALDRNIEYLNRTFTDPLRGPWVVGLPAASEGRLLGGAAQTLRWEERPDMRRIVDSVVGDVVARQRPDGYCLPYDESSLRVDAYIGEAEPYNDERRNYDRVGLTRGLVAAGEAGHPDAYPVLRRLYDWYNASSYARVAALGGRDGSASNVSNGLGGGLAVYFSPIGRPDDLSTVERTFTRRFFMDEMRRREPLAMDHYPLHVAHSYLLLAFQSWLDLYRATGEREYLDAALGGWDVVHDRYEHIGGSMAICEAPAGSYSPGSYRLTRHTGEACGSVFWADINHDLLLYDPDAERYAAEIERSIYNVVIAAQGNDGSIRYHANLVGRKEVAKTVSSCCEVMTVPFIARIPQYIYSVDADGIRVNLFAASRIDWRHAGAPIALTTTTAFPEEAEVVHTVDAPTPTTMKVRIRVPSWATADMVLLVNGEPAATGEPGQYLTLDRTWKSGDTVAYVLPSGPRMIRYVGIDQDVDHDRYALECGPVLLALLGGTHVAVAAGDLPGRLKCVDGRPLEFMVDGYPELRYVPYAKVGEEPMTCLPTMG